MKIGIMTFHSALNCGAVLQAYALQTYLERMGHEVEFINYRGISKKGIKDFLGKGIGKTWHKLEDQYYASYYRKNDRFGRLLKKGTRVYTSIEELQSNPPECDAYIAGSDQIWNVGSKKSLSKPYFLAFGKPAVKRIAFAASLGQGNVPQFLEADMTAALLKFDHISVRESNGVEYVQSLLGERKRVQHIPDPTFLLKKEDYLQIAKRTTDSEKTPYLASYILSTFSSEQLKIVDYLETKLDAKLKNLRNPDTCIRLPKAANIVVTAEEWLSYVENSRLMICCSFHAVVFSLIFHKPFVVVSPYLNQRIISLLSLVGLTDYCLYEFDAAKIDALLQNNIDWNRVDAAIAIQKQKSIDYLKEALK